MKTILVTCALATPTIAFETRLELPCGATIQDALDAVRVDKRWAVALTSVELASASVGVWGKMRARSSVLRDADRIEIYRPLRADPKLARRARAATRRSRKM